MRDCDLSVLNLCRDTDDEMGLNAIYQVGDFKYATNGFLLARIREAGVLTRPDDAKGHRNIKRFQESAAWFDQFAEEKIWATVLDWEEVGAFYFSNDEYQRRRAVARLMDVEVDFGTFARIIQTGDVESDGERGRWQITDGTAGTSSVRAMLMRRGGVEVILAGLERV